MNKVLVKGPLLNVPRYDIISLTGDAIIRVLVSVDGAIIPVVCCNEIACFSRELLLKAGKGREVYFSGRLNGNSYTDAVGTKNYLVYLVADRVAYSETELKELPQGEYTPLKYDKLPFNIEDLEDILKYME